MTKLPKWLEEKRDEFARSTNGTVASIKTFNYAWELFTEEARDTVEFYARGIIHENHGVNGDHEFGCGCCVGVETDEGRVRDDSILGKRARALKERMGW